MTRISCPEGFCIVPECGKILRADTWTEICDSHWQLVPLDIKRTLMKFGKSSARSADVQGRTNAAGGRMPGTASISRRQPLEYKKALREALAAIADKAKGFTGSMTQMITDQDLST